MNSGELKVDVPLADGESDCEESLDTLPYTLPPNEHTATPPATRRTGATTAKTGKADQPKVNLDGGDSITGSLEDLVNSFDDKLTQCFKDYQEQVEKIAPVQVSLLSPGF